MINLRVDLSTNYTDCEMQGRNNSFDRGSNQHTLSVTALMILGQTALWSGILFLLMRSGW